MGINYNQMQGGYDKFKRDDWGGQVRTPQSGNSTEMKVREDVNGSDNKPFPQQANFSVNAEATIPTPMSEPKPMRVIGETKYFKNGYGESIYADDTRNDKGVPDDLDNYSPMRVAQDSGEEEQQGI